MIPLSELDYEITKSRIYRTYWRIKYERGELHDLEDLLHDTWLSVLESGVPEGMSALTVFINRFRQLNGVRYRKEQRQPQHYSVDELADKYDDWEGFDILNGAYITMDVPLRRLPIDKIRTALTEREWEVFSHLVLSDNNQREVSFIMDVSVQYVSETVRKVRNKLSSLPSIQDYLTPRSTPVV